MQQGLRFDYTAFKVCFGLLGSDSCNCFKAIVITFKD